MLFPLFLFTCLMSRVRHAKLDSVRYIIWLAPHPNTVICCTDLYTGNHRILLRKHKIIHLQKKVDGIYKGLINLWSYGITYSPLQRGEVPLYSSLRRFPIISVTLHR